MQLVIKVNKMKIQWHKLVLKVLLWMSVEVVFNFIGIDDLADYSEFLLMPKVIVKSERSVAG